MKCPHCGFVFEDDEIEEYIPNNDGGVALTIPITQDNSGGAGA